MNPPLAAAAPELPTLETAGPSPWLEDCQRSLRWFPEQGAGFLDVAPVEYGRRYLEHYVGLAESEMSGKLNRFRVDFVERFWSGTLVDFGACAGTFLDARGRHRTYGYDVIPEVVAELESRASWRSFWDRRHLAASFWDSLEHLREPDRALERVLLWAFVSIPTFAGPEQARTSRHFKPGEHFWYFTCRGLELMFDRAGFDVVARSDEETRLGRDGISTFAFRRRS